MVISNVDICCTGRSMLTRGAPRDSRNIVGRTASPAAAYRNRSRTHVLLHSQPSCSRKRPSLHFVRLPDIGALQCAVVVQDPQGHDCHPESTSSGTSVLPIACQSSSWAASF